jgi:hypothetical protein
MSYDVAVWEGEPPADSTEALRVFEALYERYAGTDQPPSQRILDYITALTARYPDLTNLPDDDLDDSPWADGPLTGDAKGPFFYFALSYDGVDEALPFIAETARQHGVVCFDPQRMQLL